MFALSLIVCEAASYSQNKTNAKIDLENEGQDQGVEKTGLALFEWKCSIPYR